MSRASHERTTVDAEDFAQMALPLYERVARAVMAMCGDRSLAEESAQEALTRAWERVNAGEELASLEAWTMTVALNWSRSQLRRRGSQRRAVTRLRGRSGNRDRTSPMEESVDEGRIDNSTDARAVQQAVLALPRRQREVVVLHHLTDMEIAEVAEATDSSPGSVRNALFHARSTLAQTLEPHHDTEEASP